MGYNEAATPPHPAKWLARRVKSTDEMIEVNMKFYI
jgi:hypothetical protein